MRRPERKKTIKLGIPRHRWDDNIKLYLQEVGWGNIGWIDLVLDRNGWRAIVNAALNIKIP